MKRTFIILFLLTALVSTTNATIWFVKQGGAGIKNGSSWNNAAPEIADLLAYDDDPTVTYPYCVQIKIDTLRKAGHPQSPFAKYPAPGDTIFVAEGKYLPIYLWYGGAPYYYNNCKNHISIFGGFEGWEKDLCERNWEKHQTVIDGGKKCRCLWIEGDNSKVVIDGFTLTNGIGQGAGARIVNCTPQLSNLKIINNDATCGGQYNNEAGGVYFENNTTYDNPCNGKFMITTLANVLIANNTASVGAAFSAIASNVKFVNTTIACNKSDNCYIQVWYNSKIDIYNSIIWDNYADCIDYFMGSNKINFYYSNVQDLYNIGNDVVGNFSKDPQFVCQCKDYHVYDFSPVVGLGKPAIYQELYDQWCRPCYWFDDLDATKRFDSDGSINMGCYQQTLPQKNAPSLVEHSTNEVINIIEVYNACGICLYRCKPKEIESIKDNLTKGFYILVGKDENNNILMREKLIK